jgi:type II secretory pathway component PulC
MPSEEAAAVEAPKPAEKPKTELFRTDVTAAVDKGLGYFLQRVAVEPEVQAGKFQGFRVVDLEPPTFWEGVDLKPGDVVTQVNGMPIERDIDAYQAFVSLKSAPSLRVTYLRAGVPRELTFAIVDPAGKAPAAAPQGSSPASAPAKPSPATPPAPASKQSG